MTTSCNTNNANESSSLQRIFNAAWQHFIVEDNPPAIIKQKDEDGEMEKSCAYLTPEGNKCAVGLCIPDGHEAQTRNGYAFSDIVKHYPELFPDLVGVENGKLDLFQGDLHDTLVNFSTGKWRFAKEGRKTRYLAVAKSYGLIVPESV